MKYKKRRFQLITRLDLAVLLGIVLAVFLSNVAAFGQECDAVRADVVRLHILANSDSPADQQVKLRVRDRILADVGGVFAGPQTQADAKEAARQNLPAIESAARAALDEAGVDAPVRAELCRMYFTTRQYDDLMLPAGDYDAVRVTIGEGAGHNWWCVMYPPICVSAAMAEDMPAFERSRRSTASRSSNPSSPSSRSSRSSLEKIRTRSNGKPGRGHRAPAF